MRRSNLFGTEAPAPAPEDLEYQDSDITLIRPHHTLPVNRSENIWVSIRPGTCEFSEHTCFKLVLQSRVETIKIAFHEQLVIGRLFPPTEEPYLDLGPFDGYSQGVSRRHALIILDETALKLVDLASTNGTYLNGFRLIPRQPRIIMNGDQLVLGHMELFLFFDGN